MNDHGVYSVSTAYAQPVTDVEDAVMINPLADRPLHDEIETIGKALVGHWYVPLRLILDIRRLGICRSCP